MNLKPKNSLPFYSCIFHFQGLESKELTIRIDLSNSMNNNSIIVTPQQLLSSGIQLQFQDSLELNEATDTPQTQTLMPDESDSISEMIMSVIIWETQFTESIGPTYAASEENVAAKSVSGILTKSIEPSTASGE